MNGLPERHLPEPCGGRRSLTFQDGCIAAILEHAPPLVE
jgi:hypothetical protein